MKAAMGPDPANAAFTWARYRRVMRWAMAVAVALMVVALRLAGGNGAHGLIRRYVAATLVVGLGMLVSSAAMGLRFLFKTRAAAETLPPECPRSDALE